MVIVFTICSYNYSALAFALYHSLREHDPDTKFILALVDTPENYQLLRKKMPEGMNLLLVDENVVNGYTVLQKRYNITELNTAVKPFVFEHLFSTYSDSDQVMYLDPDIIIFHSLKDELLSHFDQYDMILTPHITQPRIEDKIAIVERASINTGMFNLGFLGLKRSPSVFSMLEWWKLRLRYWGYINVYEGMFTDQIWMNFLPLFYDKVLIFKHPGANVAHWNLGERHLKKIDGKYYVNDKKFPLLFYHFSAFTHFTEEPLDDKPHSKFPPENDIRQELADEIIVFYQKKLVEAGQKEFFGQKTSKQRIHFSTKEKVKRILLQHLRKRGFEISRTMTYYKRKNLI